MQYHKIPHSSLEVSKICLGTMTWGKQNSESEAHQQLDYALSQGINFIDTAEMYPVPPESETQGLTEQYIGTWLAKTGNREKVVLASKVAGPNRTNHIRENMHLDRRNIREAIHSSLERLQTDYLDLYQLHWPDRNANFFGKLGYKVDKDESYTPIIETLEVLGELVKEGKIRYIGVSNETAWGVSQYLRLAEKHELPRIITIQNPYNLLNRSFETALAEFSHREGVELLAYSPLAFGMLSGKYLNDQWPQDGRLTLFKRFSRYLNPQGKAATQAYCELADKHGLAPSQMALAYVNSRSFVAANIIGATTMEQLQSNIASFELELDDEVLEQIEAIHRQFTYPCP
ncbi:NADP(H)-dependent aldo-keto reductase [Celerinatantimonas sp. MCCC 1A17872]|uniref:NADP(H)-dependent aldo-keto reductase n=1 Tax=Celerinatantimonas sp. MCCC 1A17872 TaxID=3177514 RepID=UPI0038C6F8EF